MGEEFSSIYYFFKKMLDFVHRVHFARCEVKSAVSKNASEQMPISTTHHTLCVLFSGDMSGSQKLWCGLKGWGQVKSRSQDCGRLCF